MVEAKVAQIAKTGDAAAKKKGFADLIDKAPLGDLEKIIDVCVGEGSITKVDAKLALDYMAKTRLGTLKNAECK